MTILDAYALVAFLNGEPAAGEVAELIRSGDTAITPINLCETLYITERHHGVSQLRQRAVIEPLLADRIALVEHRYEHIWHAAQLRTRYFDRKLRALSFADCLLLAAAAPGDRVASSDPPVAMVARSEGVTFLPLPDTNGVRP